MIPNYIDLASAHPRMKICKFSRLERDQQSILIGFTSERLDGLASGRGPRFENYLQKFVDKPSDDSK
jgi:hypothetical protein